MTAKNLFDLTNRTALVTGGSRGLGLQIVEALGDYGARIVLVSRKQVDLDESAAHLEQRGIQCSVIAADLSKAATVQEVATAAIERLGHVAEWGRYGIAVNAIAPGMFPSKMTRGTIEAAGADKIAARAPLQRMGDDEYLKGVALLFASDAGKHITGQILAVDGGVSATG